ncbi:uncharacterized protein BDR25DRAFT_362536 [Lindgomyces ingoldianus]|uniref:Uncharacterized protein n=1 Tax=Lindgomyces ingoldianus TaxID=673940 RepID=A0ACB6QA06_9PLEO|nr:uncharacterized protein BDR25DRAFT_362536 [Lindgomyces ingoldianus]KAF2463736.1 hypothetical protein BDR25DRAFT_362536 [Lindgomyces ingoldianus]
MLVFSVEETSVLIHSALKRHTKGIIMVALIRFPILHSSARLGFPFLFANSALSFVHGVYLEIEMVFLLVETGSFGFSVPVINMNASFSVLYKYRNASYHLPGLTDQIFSAMVHGTARPFSRYSLTIPVIDTWMAFYSPVYNETLNDISEEDDVLQYIQQILLRLYDQGSTVSHQLHLVKKTLINDIRTSGTATKGLLIPIGEISIGEIEEGSMVVVIRIDSRCARMRIKDYVKRLIGS